MMLILAFFAFITSVRAHSWVECVSYDPISFDHDSLGAYDRSRCSGYPRGFQTQFQKGFGVDTGYNWAHNDCARDPYKSTDYSQQIPMATFQSGQTIYISHPSKNHVAETCTNQFIPSTSFTVKMSSTTGVDSFDISLPMVGGEHVNGNIDHLGYQRCFDFCSNPDKAHCLTAWVVPDNIPNGIYSFMWSWEFNPFEFYSNCFDAYIGPTNSSAPSFTNSSAPYSTNSPASSFTNSSASSSAGSSTRSSTDSSSPDDITFPPPVSVPTPASTTMSPSLRVPTTVPTTTTSPPTVSSPEIISSGSPSMSNPIARIKSYLINFTGVVNMTIGEVF